MRLGRVRQLFVLAAGTVLIAPHLASAQLGGRLVGRVRDSLGVPVGGASVTVEGMALRTLTSDSGIFRLALAVGPHTVAIRRVGFAAIYDSVQVLRHGETRRDFVFSSRVAMMDTLLVTPPLSASMRAFEDRRNRRQGAFLTSDELRKMDQRPFRSLLSKRLPGVTFVSYRAGTYLMSARGMGSVDRRMRIKAIPNDPRSPTGCWVQVYLDGARVYAPNGYADAPNLNEFLTRDLEAIEFYSGASTPPEFGTSLSGCGTLVLWTRLP